MNSLRTKSTRGDDFNWEHPRIERLYGFLKKHRAWNKEFQSRELSLCLVGCRTRKGRLMRLLYSTVNTQARPKMDLLKSFWELLHKKASREDMDTMQGFTAFLQREALKTKSVTRGRKKPDVAMGPWDALFKSLRAQPGWGVKTAALFVKATVLLHEGPRPMRFWSDATRSRAALKQDRLYLPVDRVILKVFSKLGHPCPSDAKINQGLGKHYSAEQILIWDDLWFWGFITQRGTGADRELEWNSGKFWSQFSMPKEHEAELQGLAKQFLRLLS